MCKLGITWLLLMCPKIFRLFTRTVLQSYMEEMVFICIFHHSCHHGRYLHANRSRLQVWEVIVVNFWATFLLSFGWFWSSSVAVTSLVLWQTGRVDLYSWTRRLRVGGASQYVMEMSPHKNECSTHRSSLWFLRCVILPACFSHSCRVILM